LTGEGPVDTEHAMDPLRAVKGMYDVLPEDSIKWQRIEATFARTAALYGFREMRTPLVEPTRLFVRTVGEATDIVEKEMYSFAHHDEQLTLRPEGTAGAARAYVEHHVHAKEAVTRWYYLGPMFRAEKPQRGRYRQFSQAGGEIFGDPGPGCDAEMIDMLVGFFKAIGVPDLEVLVNSIGSGDTRTRFRDALLAYFGPKKALLSEDSQRRLESNPLRILDSKDPRDVEASKDAPTILEHLSDEDRAHFDGLRRLLDTLGIAHKVDTRLVRGLDYYTRTIFEIKGATQKLGAGNTLVGGGRYDNMIAELGGPSVPAIGFAAGIDRLLIAAEPAGAAAVVDAFVAPLGEAAMGPALVLARALRAKGVSVEADTRGASLKALLRRANSLGARLVLMLGEGELGRGVVTLKDLAAHAQEELQKDQAVAIVTDRLAAAGAVRREEPQP
jgi:histidyl-tRNA synthetase